MSKPTIGRIVHWVLRDGATIRPAQVTSVHGDGKVNLVVTLEPCDEGRESAFLASVEFCPLMKPHTWHWPQATH